MNLYEKFTSWQKGQLNKKSGVYKIVNVIDGKIYVGESKNIERRFIDHIYKLLKKEHVNNHLQNAVNLYGLENFRFEVLEFCDSIETKRVEHHWVIRLQSFEKDKGYNIKPTDPEKVNLRKIETSLKIYQTKKKNAEIKGYWLSPETIQKIQQSRKGYRHSEETKAKIGFKSLGRKIPKSDNWKRMMSEKAMSENWGGQKKPILQISKTGELIKEWKSITEASESGFSMTAIIEVCKGKKSRKTHKGYVWKYKNL